MPPYHHYNSRLRPFARKLRNGATRGEKRLWYELLARRQCLGYRFLRQRPIDRYIVDFFCKELKLIIEVDGPYHDCDDQQERDRIRQERLEELGYAFLWFEDRMIKHDLPAVSEVLYDWIKAREAEHKHRLSTNT
jgi:very-short-patch-repair endonuclease